MNILKHLIRPGIGVGFGLATWLLSLWAHQYPEIVEHWYSRGLFQNVRWVLDGTLGCLPFPAFYLFWTAVILFWVWAVRKCPKLTGFWNKTAFWTAKLLGFAGLILGLFFWMWGFNYSRVPMEKQLQLQVMPLDSAMLWQELMFETSTLDSLRTLLVGADTSAMEGKELWPLHAEDTVRVAVENWLSAQGFPVGGHVRGRALYPEGLLFKFGASGLYWPFIGEGNVEAGLHPLRTLPTMAHEMSHGYGFSDEGICNFITFVACTESANHYLAYCAHLDYWHTVAQNCLASDVQRYDKQFRPFIPAGIRQDDRAIRRQHQKFKEIAPAVRYQVYDAYLKSQGIASGMLNYEEVLMLVRAWRAKR